MSFKNQEICTLGSRSKILIIKMWGASKSFQFIRWRTKLTLDLEDEILGETRLEAPKVVYDCCCWKKFMQIYSRSLHSILSSHCVTFFRIVIFFFHRILWALQPLHVKHSNTHYARARSCSISIRYVCW